MSADRWATCPKCWEEKEKDKKEMIVVDFEEKWNNIEKEYREYDDGNRTLEERYELYVRLDKSFYVSYYAECVRCGFTKSYHYNEREEKT